MKEILKFALVALLALGVTVACKNDGPDDNGGNDPIEIPEGDKTQTAFADDTTTGELSFTAKAAWEIDVNELNATRASSVGWMRLYLDGVETYSGPAGEFTLEIRVDENYTGEAREAEIVISSGGAEVEVSVTQAATKQDGTVPVAYNKITINGTTYDFSQGSGDMDYWGQYNDGYDTEEIFLDLYWKGKDAREREDNIWIEFDMMLPAGNERILAGTYTFGSNYEAYTFQQGEFSSIEMFEEGNFVDITGGTVVVSIEGTGTNAVYTVAMDCSLEGNGSLKGTWRGTLRWTDETGKGD